MAPNQKIMTSEDDFHQTETSPMEIKEILYDGYYYDVTDFARRHPGGNIIDFYTDKGEDATHAIQQFHQRSTKRVTAIMKSFKRRPATDRHRKLFPAF